ncbi:antitoxin of toxin-antitoxin stability system [Thioalkalivibrio sulfidiphilus]|nr:antitoxin of toxin-antitoxin stability system [Thioalkalivibrio sulfidiphilus]
MADISLDKNFIYFVYTFSLRCPRGDADMAKETVFTMKMEKDLRDEFMAEAKAADRPASQVVRELMREFIQRQREAREYESYIHHKVQLARDSVNRGQGLSHEEVEAVFTARRKAMGGEHD